MKKFLQFGLIIILLLGFGAFAFGAFGDPFISLQLGTDPDPNEVLTTDGTNSSWIDVNTLVNTGNPFNQWLDTTSTPTFGGINASTTNANNLTVYTGISGTGWDSAWASKYNATTTLNGFTPSNYFALTNWFATTTWAGGSQNITIGGFASSTSGLYTQGSGHYGGTLSVDSGITANSFIIGANTLNTSEWAYLDGQDQGVKIASTPQFARLGVGTSETPTIAITAYEDTAVWAVNTNDTTNTYLASNIVGKIYGIYATQGSGDYAGWFDGNVGIANGKTRIPILNSTTTNIGTLKIYTGSTFPANDIVDAEVSNTLTCSDLQAGSSVVANSEVDDNLTISGGTLSSNSVAGTWTTTGTLTIGDGGDIINIDSSSWDVTAGAFSGITTLSMTGDLIVNGGDIGLTADTDLLQLASGVLTANGDLWVTDGVASGLTTAAGYTSLVITDNLIPLLYMEDTGGTSGQRVMRFDMDNGIFKIGFMGDDGQSWVKQNAFTANYLGNISTAGSFTMGSGAAGIDYILAFDGETTDGFITWMEDEDYFRYSDDILMNSTERIYFNTVSQYIYSPSDGALDFVSGSSINFNQDTYFKDHITLTNEMTFTRGTFVVSKAITFNGGTQAIITADDGWVITDVYFQVTTIWDGTGTITIGDAGDVDGFLTTTNITKETTGYYGANMDDQSAAGHRGAYMGDNGATNAQAQRKIYTASTVINAYATAGTSTQGAGTVYVVITKLK